MLRFILFISIIIFVQTYFFLSSKTVFNFKGNLKNVYTWTYILFFVSLFVALFFQDKLPDGLKKIVINLFFLTSIGQLLAVVFFLIEDVRWLGEWFIKKTIGSIKKTSPPNTEISRLVFLKWLGLGIGATFTGALLYGFTNRYNYQLHKIKLVLKNLSPNLKGLKIIQISDIHSGSLKDEKAIQKGIDKIMKQKPDLILFTGDLVNNLATEIIPFKPLFSQLKAPLGVFSTLGNHDYGDYVEWESRSKKEQNLIDLKKHHFEMGWTLLNNENKILEFNKEKFTIIGVENWSSKGFVKHGNLKKASEGLEDISLKILMSHDPSHWEAEVLKSPLKIDLTLSGHTHGMQFGVELPWFKWSPVQYLYKQWAGLYNQNDQYLYVNRGFGFLGYQGRVGILPEITLIELA